MADITISGPDGSMSAYLALPKDRAKAPGILVIQEIFGVNKVMRDLTDGFAAQGYVALCPDLFWRQQPGIQLTDQTEAEWKRGFELYQGFNEAKGVGDLIVSLEHLRGVPHCNGKAGSVGYCLGGKLAYLMATRSNADANVGYYGGGIDKLLGEAAAITKPLLLHIAAKDQYCPPELQAAIIASLARNSHVTLHSYPDADHAFARIGGAHYDKAAADIANRRTAEFFKKHLG
jgi:carboxymethylenebutenolidase